MARRIFSDSTIFGRVILSLSVALVFLLVADRTFADIESLYSENPLDHNAILGEHPEVQGFYMAVGFSGHGLMQAPAVGKSLSEAIRLGRFETIDVTCLSIARFETGQLVIEEAVI
jgi:hypothetical protein